MTCGMLDLWLVAIDDPDANWLAQYPTIIYETGDNYQPNGTFTVPTLLTQLDMDRLTEYANNGGVIIAFGQDLAAVTNSNRTDGNEAFFYDFTLGAEWLQDSVNAEEVFTDTAQLIYRSAGHAVQQC